MKRVNSLEELAEELEKKSKKELVAFIMILNAQNLRLKKQIKLMEEKEEHGEVLKS